MDEVSPPGDDLESTLLSEWSEIAETGKPIEIVVDINQTSQSSIQSYCQDLIERVDEILSSSSCLIQELAFSGGFAKHESFESLDVTPQRELVTYPSISEEEVLTSDGSYSAHKDELVSDPSSTVDGVLLDHASNTAGPPMDNDGESIKCESSMDQIVTRRDLDVAVRNLESKIENFVEDDPLRRLRHRERLWLRITSSVFPKAHEVIRIDVLMARMSQREKDGRPSSYVYSPVFNRYGHSRVDPRRYVQENRFGVQYRSAI
ncbi:hypothetical protein KQX54_012251 [Cotesia glomerata]|uniref:Uncharacterized protein n=1 Tax=Cotesia glomerata TaxID=32391 RepID=A0AAV7I8V8_COTGL|nr:hypothetical protein KQX54_012251 [Cotesia glomerata]